MLLKQKALVVMVGLPGRGKSFLARKLAHYFRWIGLETKIFTSFKKELIAKRQDFCLINDSGEASIIMNEILQWLDVQECGLAIYDATNHNAIIRKEIINIADNKKLSVLFIECDCSLDNIIIDVSAELEEVLIDHIKVDITLLYKSLWKKLSHIFTAVSEDENVPLIKLLYKNSNFEIQTYGKMEYLFKMILQYLLRFRFGQYDVYMLWHNYIDNNPLREISVEGINYAEKLVKKFQGKMMRIYSGTEMAHIHIFNMMVKKVNIPFDVDLRQSGANFLKVLDQKEFGLNFDGLNYQQISDSFLNNPKIARTLKEYGLNTDIMCAYDIDRTILDVHHNLSPEMSYYYTISSDNDLRKRLASVVSELDAHNENRLIIASKLIISTLLTYFIRESEKINLPDNCLLKLSPLAKNHLDFAMEIVSI